jgi:poly-gamma-glutamate synthesis protein (capsule biosynthesis protein)
MSRRIISSAFLCALIGCSTISPMTTKTILAPLESQGTDPTTSNIPPVQQIPSASTTLSFPIAENTTEPVPIAGTTGSASINLAAVGDMMMARTIGERIIQNEGESIFASVAPLLQQADLAFGNLECSIGEDGTRAEKGYTFRAPVETAQLLKQAGFGLLSLSNNHILDYGDSTFEQTLDLLHNEGILTVGAGRNSTEARSPGLVTIHGIRIAFLSYADIPKEYQGFDAYSWTAGPDTPGIAWADPTEIDSDIQAIRATVDYVVVLFHFGVEGAEKPSNKQIELAQLAIDSGANIVIGSHPHILQPIEEYHGGLIAYSMGNFVFDGFQDAANISQILMITLAPGKAITYYSIPVLLREGIPVPT